MVITKSFSNSLPENKIEQLEENKYSCRICENIVKLSDDSPNTYSFDSYRDIFVADRYEDLLTKIIHTRYSTDDETNLINDFLEQGANEKYSKYREFVSWAKSEAKRLKGVK